MKFRIIIVLCYLQCLTRLSINICRKTLFQMLLIHLVLAIARHNNGIIMRALKRVNQAKRWTLKLVSQRSCCTSELCKQTKRLNYNKL